MAIFIYYTCIYIYYFLQRTFMTSEIQVLRNPLKVKCKLRFSSDANRCPRCSRWLSEPSLYLSIRANRNRVRSVLVVNETAATPSRVAAGLHKVSSIPEAERSLLRWKERVLAATITTTNTAARWVRNRKDLLASCNTPVGHIVPISGCVQPHLHRDMPLRSR